MNNTDRTQANALIDLLLANGCRVSVHDGEELTLKRSTDRAAILDAMGTTEADTLTWRDADGLWLGEFVLIYGNGPGELVADHTANPGCERLWQAWDRTQSGVEVWLRTCAGR